MKTLNRLLLAAAALAVSGTLATQAGEPAQISKNAAWLASPRYLEAHPELLRGQPSVVESPALKTSHLAKLTENTALVNSPRFREAHPELRWIPTSADQIVAQDTSRGDRLSKLTQNKALATSPRFLEQHPELLHSAPVYEIAPLK
jgi:hypothetical protein